MAQRTSDNDGNDNLRATGEERTIGMRADASEASSAERTFQNNASTHANAGVQILDLDVENSESDALAGDNAPASWNRRTTFRSRRSIDTTRRF